MTMFSGYLTHTVDLIKITMTAGVRSEASPVSEDAFITQGVSVIRDESGFHRQSYTKVYLDSSADVDIGDEITVDGETRPVKELLHARDLFGVHHLEVNLG